MRLYVHYDGPQPAFTCVALLPAGATASAALDVRLVAAYLPSRPCACPRIPYGPSMCAVSQMPQQWALYSPRGPVLSKKYERKHKQKLVLDGFSVHTDAGDVLASSLPLEDRVTERGDIFVRKEETKAVDEKTLEAAEKKRQEGNALMKSKQWKKAVACYSAALDLAPSLPLLTNRSLAYFHLKQYQASLADAERAIGMDASSAKAHYRAGRAAAALEQHAVAVARLSRGLSLCKAGEKKEFQRWLQASRERQEQEEKEGPEKRKQLEEAVRALTASVKQGQAAFAKGEYRKARGIFEGVLQVVPNEKTTLQHLAAIEIMARRPAEAVTILRKATKANPEEFELFMMLAEALETDGQHKAAMEVYKKAGQLPAAAQATKRIQLGTAQALKGMGQPQVALSLIAATLREDEADFGALLLYAELMEEQHPGECTKVLLQLLVKQAANKRVRKLLVSCVTKNGLDCLFENLQDAKSSASALGFLALIFKDNGNMNVATNLFQRAYSLEPTSASYALNYVHALEICCKYEQATEVLVSYLAANPTVSLPCPGSEHVVTCADILAAYSASSSSPADLTGTFRVEEADSSLASLTEPQLDLLAIAFTLVKVLYVADGNLAAIARLVRVVEQCRHGRELHKTTIRNEHAYYCCIAQLLDTHTWPLPQGKPVMVMGDSHSLTPAWRQLQVAGEDRLLVPKLVTGCKMWHLNERSVFFPKKNFFNVAETIANGSQVVFVFGEIDCREGILVAVEQCKYRTFEEGAEHTIGIFLATVRDLVKTKAIDAYIHPVVPVLDQTRDAVKTFNGIFRRMVQETEGVTWLDFFDDLLTEAGDALKEEYKLDGTHMHPAYLPLVARELTAAMGKK